LFFGKVLRATRVASPVRPSRFIEFVKSARQTKPGPHLAPMFHAAAHPDKEALVEYGEHGVRRLSWGELDATINRLAHALVARGWRCRYRYCTGGPPFSCGQGRLAPRPFRGPAALGGEQPRPRGGAAQGSAR